MKPTWHVNPWHADPFFVLWSAIAEGAARLEGESIAASLASWFEIRDTAGAARLLKMLDDGDPEAYDHLPRFDLSGEWADGLTFDAVCSDIGARMSWEGVNLGMSDDEWATCAEDVWRPIVNACEEACDWKVGQLVERMLRDAVTNVEGDAS